MNLIEKLLESLQVWILVIGILYVAVTRAEGPSVVSQAPSAVEQGSEVTPTNGETIEEAATKFMSSEAAKPKDLRCKDAYDCPGNDICIGYVPSIEGCRNPGSNVIAPESLGFCLPKFHKGGN